MNADRIIFPPWAFANESETEDDSDMVIIDNFQSSRNNVDNSNDRSPSIQSDYSDIVIIDNFQTSRNNIDNSNDRSPSIQSDDSDVVIIDNFLSSRNQDDDQGDYSDSEDGVMIDDSPSRIQNVDVGSPQNVDVEIPQNVDVEIPQNVDVEIPQNSGVEIPQNSDDDISENEDNEVDDNENEPLNMEFELTKVIELFQTQWGGQRQSEDQLNIEREVNAKYSDLNLYNSKKFRQRGWYKDIKNGTSIYVGTSRKTKSSVLLKNVSHI
jgi:hypothetical protein